MPVCGRPFPFLNNDVFISPLHFLSSVSFLVLWVPVAYYGYWSCFRHVANILYSLSFALVTVGGGPFDVCGA